MALGCRAKTLKQKERVKPVYRSVYSLRRVCYLYFERVSTMTRKRFIKVLMSHGISRNAARRIAENTRDIYGCYTDGINSTSVRLEIACADARAAIKRAGKGLFAVVQSITRILYGMVEEQEGKNNA